MMLSLYTFLSLALSIIASPVDLASRSQGGFSVPLTKVVNVTSGHNLVKSGLARAQNFHDRATGKVGKRQADPVLNEVVSYLATINVGANDQAFNLIVDTGSSNTWVGAGTRFAPSSTSTDTEELVAVQYGSGFFIGTEFIDQVAITNDLVIPRQSIGTAIISQGFEGVDGILGIGPTDLTEGTVDGSDTIPTVTDNLFNQGTISTEVIGISFEPTTEEEDLNGELFFGGVDDSKFIGDITFVPRESEFWGITQSISYAGTTIMPSSSGIVDTGTTLLFLPTSTFNTYIAATGGVLDENTGLFAITQEQFDNLSSLIFTIGGTDFELTPNAQIWPRALNTEIGGTADAIYLVASDIGSGNSFDFINGFVFLERFYSVFDTTNNQVGFANTAFTNATTN